MVNTDVATLPAATIARRTRSVFDLYFPLPPGCATSKTYARITRVGRW
jgi:hypothetical protein